MLVFMYLFLREKALKKQQSHKCNFKILNASFFEYTYVCRDIFNEENTCIR